MAQVHLWGELRRACGGIETVEVDAANVNQVIEALEARFPPLREIGLAGMTVAIDGELMSNAEFEPVHSTSEVHFLQPTGGG